MLRVRVLGELALEVDGAPLEPPTSRRARSLLGLLAVERRVHSRSQLAGRFWPDVLEESARTSLRSALSAVRRALGPDADRYLLAGRDTVSLASAELVWTDIGELESRLEEGRVDDALDLVRGELLDGLDDDWILERRDGLRERLGAALRRLADEAEAAGDLREAVTLTRRRVTLDPLAEEPQRELIRRLAAGGDRAAALAAYRRLQDRLRTELGIPPSTATRELVEGLRAEEPAPATAPTARPTGTVTLLLTDQVSSTETLQRLGDDEAERLRRAHFGLLREAASAHGGQEVKNLGDGLMVVFASAVDGVACAIAMQQAVHRFAQRVGDDRLAVRVGLNAGDPIVDGDDYFGTPVVVTKRLCDRAGARQILASDVIRTLVGNRGGFEFRGAGALELKGIAAPVEACEVVWSPATAQRLPLPPAVAGAGAGRFVGRAEALADARREWDAAREGSRRVLLLAGEPGIGKTRLASELCRAAHEAGAAVLAGRCHEEMVVPYQPFTEALRHYVAACPPAEFAVQVAPRRAALAALLPELGDVAAPSDAGHERFRVFEAVSATLADAALARPVVLLLDDLHWADEASLLLLRHLVRTTEGAPLLVLGTYRATELARDGELAAALAELRRARAVSEIDLGGLPEADVAALIAAQSGGQASGEFARRVAERTEGNPFFIEELLRHVEDPAGDPLGDLTVPESVKDLLRRRLVRLGEDCRRALLVAAVAGREFDLGVLTRVLDVPADALLEQVEEAVDAQVLAEEPGAVGRFRFAHHLIRETVYGEMSATRRALVHRRVGEAIEDLHGDRLDEWAGALAHHFRAAGDVDKAFEYHRRAADEAERVSAFEAAFEHLTGGIAAGELLGRTAAGDREIRDMYRRRAWIAFFAATVDFAQRDYAVALEGARAAGDRRTEMRVLNGLGLYWYVRDTAAATRYQEESLAIAEELGDTEGQIEALSRLTLVQAVRLDLSGAIALGERALALARDAGDEHAASRAMDGLKFTALMLGDTERLEQLTAEMAPGQRARNDIWHLQWTLLESAFAPLARGRWDEAAARMDEALGISRRTADRLCEAMVLRGLCLLERSRGAYRQALTHARELGALSPPDQMWHGWTAGTRAQVMVDLRRLQDAADLLDSALASATRLDARAQAFGVLGELAWARLRLGDEAGAATAAQQWDEIERSVRTPPGQAPLHAWPTYTSRARVAAAWRDADRAEAILHTVREPIVRAGHREAAAATELGLAECARVRGDEAAAREALHRGLQAAGADALPAVRLELCLALARTEPDGEAAATARMLTEDIARSLDDADEAERFRAAVQAERAGPVGTPS